jgi:glycosyltransferase involved in cell wall biosynthesis
MAAANSRAIWISWQQHRRTREICRALDLELFEITSKRSRLLRYPLLFTRTVACLARTRPRVVFVQCPSVLLGVWAGLLKYVFGYTLVADLHNEAVEPFNYSFPGYRRLLTWIGRMADVCLVTNEALKTVVEGRGGAAFVLPDRVPNLDRRSVAELGLDRYVVFICTYAPDEPYLEMLQAADLLGSVPVYVTGDPRRLPAGTDVPANVRLTGFLPESEYEDLLRGADVIVDLTRMENCLVCGAYEAVAVERPLVTSDTEALRRFFRRGTVYSTHTSRSLAASIALAIEHRTRLGDEMAILKQELSQAWTRQERGLRELLGLG